MCRQNPMRNSFRKYSYFYISAVKHHKTRAELELFVKEEKKIRKIVHQNAIV